MTTKLQFISHCGKSWIVGINGKNISDCKTSGGSFGEVPYMAIANDQIEAAPEIPKELHCRVCGVLVEVQDAKAE